MFESILGLLTGVPGAIADYFKAKQEYASIERRQEMEYAEAVHVRKCDLVKQGLTADMNWEMEFARQAATSWKDEYTLLIVSIPAVGAFVPGFVEYINAGFAALNTTPVWYQILLSSMFLATIGVRFWRRTQSDT